MNFIKISHPTPCSLSKTLQNLFQNDTNCHWRYQAIDLGLKQIAEIGEKVISVHPRLEVKAENILCSQGGVAKILKLTVYNESLRLLGDGGNKS